VHAAVCSKRLDTADIVRDACLHHLAEFLLAMALLTIRSIEAISRQWYRCAEFLGHSHWAKNIENKLSGTFSAADSYLELGNDEVKQWN